MIDINANINAIKNSLPTHVTLVAVSKTKPKEDILQAYQSGHRIFGENKVQELVEKATLLPGDIQWHMIGHLQTNKVKYIAPFIALIHGVDSEKLLIEIDKRAQQNNRVIECLLQLKISQENSKFGLTKNDLVILLSKQLPNVKIVGLMGMASNTKNKQQIQSEFRYLKAVFDDLTISNSNIRVLSMGMSGDYNIAVSEGSNMIRLGSSIFGKRSIF